MTAKSKSTKLQEVATRAKDPSARFYALAHLIDVTLLREAYRKLRSRAAVGVDGVTKKQYGEQLEENLQNLHERLRSGRYRHQLIRRVHIPKEGNKTRPIGISTVEDKIVQGALTTVLRTVFEPIFSDSSYGSRPKRGAHGAIRALNGAAYRKEVNWVYEADIQSFFDNVNRDMLLDFIQERVPDGSIRRLVGKCLHVGVLDGEETSEPDVGTPQGSVLSPMLANVYLHHVLDHWFHKVVYPRLRGKAHLIRYVDDFVVGFERKDDAERFAGVVGKRMARFGLTLHPDKTRLLRFTRPSRSQTSGKGPDTFDFLGFTCYWRRTRSGWWQPALKTRHGRLRKAIKAVYEWCRDHRHLPVEEQHRSLILKLKGHFNYFGVNGNVDCLYALVEQVRIAWRFWLNRRSQRARMTWERYEILLSAYPLPTPRIVVQVWGSSSS